MNYVVFDLETNGIGSFRPPTQTITQLAFIKFDENGTDIKQYCKILKGATDIIKHPSITISLDQIRNNGIEPMVAINEFINSIDDNTILCSHNFEFDSGLIKNAIKNTELSFPNNRHICTMKSSTNYCKLPKKGLSAHYPGYKYPSLEELANKLNISSEKGKFHDALYDCTITKQCIHEGLNLGIFNL